MFRTLYSFVLSCSFLVASFAHAGIVIESTRYLYKEGAREISAQIENKDNIPYLIKSWVETSAGTPPSFMATPPLFRLEAKQQNTVRLFSTGKVNAPTDRETVFFFNVMSIPPSDEANASNNTIQLAVRHRMRLVYRPKTLFDLTPNVEAKKIEWKKSGNKLTIKNPTPFFYYFNSIKIGGKEFKQDVNSIAPMTTKEVTLKESVTSSDVTWKIVNDYGGAGSLYSSSL